MSGRNSLQLQTLVKLGLASTTGVALVCAVWYWWRKKQQNDKLKDMFKLDPKKEQARKAQNESDRAESNGKSANGKPVVNKDDQSSLERMVTVSVTIPQEFAKEFVGSQGSNVRRIQNDTNTKITSARESLDNGDRVYTVRGTQADVRLAELQIKKFIMSQPIKTTVTIEVPTSAMGRIIGRGGDTIRQIQDRSKARVQTDHEDDAESRSPSATSFLKIRGTLEQIEMAKNEIQEKVNLEEATRKKLTLSTTGRTKRRVGAGTPPSIRSTAEGHPLSSFPPRRDGIWEVFVSCVYNPNRFFLQVVGNNSIELDKLCDRMTEYYRIQNEAGNQHEEVRNFHAGDLVAAIFDVDNKIYRARILELEESAAKVVFVDYGDKKLVPISKIYPIRPEHLQLKFQAFEVTLNLDYQDVWSTEIIEKFCHLTACAEWIILTAKVKEYLKDEDNRDIIWVELFDGLHRNIGEEILKSLKGSVSSGSGMNSDNSPCEEKAIDGDETE